MLQLPSWSLPLLSVHCPILVGRSDLLLERVSDPSDSVSIRCSSAHQAGGLGPCRINGNNQVDGHQVFFVFEDTKRRIKQKCLHPDCANRRVILYPPPSVIIRRETVAGKSANAKGASSGPSVSAFAHKKKNNTNNKRRFARDERNPSAGSHVVVTPSSSAKSYERITSSSNSSSSASSAKRRRKKGPSSAAAVAAASHKNQRRPTANSRDPAASATVGQTAHVTGPVSPAASRSATSEPRIHPRQVPHQQPKQRPTQNQTPRQREPNAGQLAARAAPPAAPAAILSRRADMGLGSHIGASSASASASIGPRTDENSDGPDIRDTWDVILQKASSNQLAKADKSIDFRVIDCAVDAWNEDADAQRLLASISSAESSQASHLLAQLKELEEAFHAALMGYLNSFWTYITDMSPPIVIRRGSSRDKKGEWIQQDNHQTEAGFEKYLQNRTVAIRYVSSEKGEFSMPRPHPLAKLWLRSTLRNDKRKVVFDPAVPPGTASADFNLWQGYRISRKRAATYVEQHQAEYAAQILLWWDHLEKIMCSGEPASFEYLANWLASIIQRPHVKTCVATLLQSEPGAGKGTLMQIMRQIMGEHFSSFVNLSDLTSRFNGDGLSKCVLGMVDEVSPDARAMSLVKCLITEPTHRLERKHMDAYHLESFANFMFLANHQFPIHIEPGERRFFIPTVSNKYAGPQTEASRLYFHALLAIPVEFIAHALYTRDISSFNCRIFPATEGQLAQKILTLSEPGSSSHSVEKYWLSRLQEGTLPGNNSLGNHSACREAMRQQLTEFEYPRLKTEVFKQYLEFAGPSACSDSLFWKRLAAMAPFSDKRLVVFGGKKVGVVSFSSLNACMEEFAGKVLRQQGSSAFNELLQGNVGQRPWRLGQEPFHVGQPQSAAAAGAAGAQPLSHPQAQPQPQPLDDSQAIAMDI